MTQDEVNEKVGQKIMELTAMRLGELMYENIRFRAANEVLGEMMAGANDGGQASDARGPCEMPVG